MLSISLLECQSNWESVFFKTQLLISLNPDILVTWYHWWKTITFRAQRRIRMSWNKIYCDKSKKTWFNVLNFVIPSSIMACNSFIQDSALFQSICGVWALHAGFLKSYQDFCSTKTLFTIAQSFEVPVNIALLKSFHQYRKSCNDFSSLFATKMIDDILCIFWYYIKYFHCIFHNRSRTFSRFCKNYVCCN